MSVKELVSHPVYNEIILVEGCIVIIDHDLWLIDSNHVNDFPNSVKIRINNYNLKSILLNSVALYSGVTALFHDAQITGYISKNDLLNQIGVDVIALSIKDDNEWKHIDLNAIVKDKEQEKSESNWNDLFK
ncbi:hypothetical protein [Orbus mooreae]|uniref:hypothetical protein n=1 Tax=Orbus mooreae TaxID=3074107 RepID=UPI00370DCE66